MIWLLVGIYGCIIFIELPPLLKKRWYRELGVFVIVFAVGVYMSMALYYQWPLFWPFHSINAYLETT